MSHTALGLALSALRAAVADAAARVQNHLLALVCTGLSVAQSVLYIRAFGVSQTSDALYHAAAVMSAACVLPALLTEQFLHFHQASAEQGADRAARFLAFNLALVLLAGLILLGTFAVCQDGLMHWLYPGPDAGLRHRVGAFLRVMCLQLPLVGLHGLLQALAVSQGRIRTLYTGRIAAAGVILASQLLLLAGVLGVSGYPWALVVASATQVVVLAWAQGDCLREAARAARGLDMRFARAQWHYLRSSFIMRFGHNLQAVALPLVTSAFLSHFDSHLATCHGYATKFYAVIQSAVLAPAQLGLQHRLSRCIARREFGQITALARSHLQLCLPVLAAASGAVWLLIPRCMSLLHGGIDADSLALIQVAFLCMAAWLVFQCVEGPFVIAIVADNRGAVFVVANALNIGIVAASAWLFSQQYLAFLLAQVGAQFVSLCLYLMTTAAMLRRQHALPPLGVARR